MKTRVSRKTIEKRVELGVSMKLTKALLILLGQNALTHKSIYICSTKFRHHNNMQQELPYTFAFLEKATETLRAIAHPHRLLIVEMLFQNKEMNVTEMYERLGIEQAVASHHLRILKDRGVVNVRRDGKNSLYSLVSEEYFKILQVLDEVI